MEYLLRSLISWDFCEIWAIPSFYSIWRQRNWNCYILQIIRGSRHKITKSRAFFRKTHLKITSILEIAFAPNDQDLTDLSKVATGKLDRCITCQNSIYPNEHYGFVSSRVDKKGNDIIRNVCEICKLNDDYPEMNFD